MSYLFLNCSQSGRSQNIAKPHLKTPSCIRIWAGHLN